MQGSDESDSLSLLQRNGFYITLGYSPVKDKLQFIARLDDYDPNSEISNNIINKYILAANWYFNSNTRIQLEYDFVKEEGVEIQNNLFAILFQAGF